MEARPGGAGRVAPRGLEERRACDRPSMDGLQEECAAQLCVVRVKAANGAIVA